MFSLIFIVAFLIGCAIGMVLCIPLGLIPAFIAKNKGYSFWLFWLFGFAALLPAIIVACVLRNKKANA